MVTLPDLCELNMGQSPDSSSYNADRNGLPFYQGNADFGERTPIARVWCSSPVKTADKGDILLSVRAPIGAVNIACERCCIGRGLAALSARDSVALPEYLYYAVVSKKDELNLKGTGSTFKAVSKKHLRNSIFPATQSKNKHKSHSACKKLICSLQIAALN